MRISDNMRFVELEGVEGTGGGNLRFNLDYLLGYTEEEIWLHGSHLIEITPGTAKALDAMLKDMGHSIYLCETPSMPSEVLDVQPETVEESE